MRHRLALLISGSGTTMQQMIKACQSGEVQMDVACVIASKENASGIEKARNLGVPVIVIDPRKYKNDEDKVDLDAFGKRLVDELQKHRATVVTQNGWLPLTPERIIDAFPDAIFNQHPGPVPDFGGVGMYGRRVHAARLMFARKVKRDFWTQAIAQRVHRDFDLGAIVKAEEVEILLTDTVEDLQQRVLPIEHRVQIELLKDFVKGELKEIGPKKLVLPEEKELLVTVKEMAKLLYPRG